MNHGVISAAHPGGQVDGTTEPGAAAGQSFAVTAPSSATVQLAPEDGRSMSPGAEIATPRIQWLLVAPPVRAVNPRKTFSGSA